MDNINYELSQSTKPKIGYVGENDSCHLWHGSRGVILKDQKISRNYWFLSPYTYNLVKMQILGNFK